MQVARRINNFRRLQSSRFHLIQALFPAEAVTPLVTSDAAYDAFLNALADANGGPIKEMRGNLSTIGDLVRRWNRITALLGDDGTMPPPDLLDNTETRAEMTQLRELVQRADRLKSVTRQVS